MKQQSLAAQSVFENMGGRAGASCFWMRWNRWCRGRRWKRWSSHTTRRRATGVSPWACESCCGRTSCSSGSTFRTRAWKKRSMSAPALRRFVGVDLGVAPAPDETTVCRFRHLLEKHDLGGLMLEAVNVHLEAKGLRIATGTIVDATILHAPSSTKNATGERDPAMHQTCKGNQWYFGLKAHIGVDSKQGTVHSVCTTAASVSDKHMLPHLLHGKETKVWGDGGYQGQRKAIRQAAPKAKNMTCRRTRFKQYVDELQRAKNRTKSRVRARVEHPFRILKRVFGFDKVRYWGIAKNHHRLCANFALINLYLHRKRLATLAR